MTLQASDTCATLVVNRLRANEPFRPGAGPNNGDFFLPWRRLRERFAAAAAGERRALVAALTQAGVRHVPLSTEGDWLRPLAAFLRRKERAA